MGQLDTGYGLDVVDAIQPFGYSHNARDDKIQVGGISVVRDAYGLLELADAYWVQVDEDTGYYDADSGPDVWNSGMVLHALSLAYQASGRDLYLDRASSGSMWRRGQ